MALVTYGLDIDETGDETADQLACECFAFRTGRTIEQGGLGKFLHFKHIVDLLWNNPELGCNKRFVWNEWAEGIFRDLCDNKYYALSGSASSGKSDPLALWAIVNYISDPTHCKVLVMSTTIDGAKQRIWKTLIEYWREIPDFEKIGKFLDSRNIIKGLNYDGVTFGDSSGIRLVATDKSKEKDALDKLIGIKAPKTDGVDGRIGKVIVEIDEMTGCSVSVYHAAKTNLASNRNFQLAGIANFNDPFDPFGLLFKPKLGYKWLLDDETIMEFETEDGGKARILDAELSPRLAKGQEECSWMLSREHIEELEAHYGRNSPQFYRMVKGRPSPKGSDISIYDPAELIKAGAMERVVWSMAKPVMSAFLDVGFTNGGDPSVATFSKLGTSIKGVQTLEFVDQITINIDLKASDKERGFQVAHEYKKECIRRGIPPRLAGYDASGGGGPFGDILRTVWSKEVLPVEFGGLASTRPSSTVNSKPASEMYANRVTELWYSPKGFFRAGQIRGVSDELAKELCSRRIAKDNQKGEASRKLKTESKRDYKMREGKSCDNGDSALGNVEVARQRLGFRCVERAAKPETVAGAAPQSNSFPMHLFQTGRQPLSFKRGPRRSVVQVAHLDYHGGL